MTGRVNDVRGLLGRRTKDKEEGSCRVSIRKSQYGALNERRVEDNKNNSCKIRISQ